MRTQFLGCTLCLLFGSSSHTKAQTEFELPPALAEINHLEDATPSAPYSSPTIAAMGRHTDGTRFYAGLLRGDVDFDAGPGQLIFGDDWGDPFIVIYPPNDVPIVHQFLNNQGATAGEILDLKLDADGYAIVLGNFDADVLVVGDGLPDLTGTFDTPFLARINQQGVVQWAFSLPDSPSTPQISSLTVNGDRIAIGGRISRFGADFDPDPGQVAFAAADNIRAPDPFVASYDLNGDFLWVRVFRQLVTGQNADDVGDMLFTANNQLLIGGSFGSQTDFFDSSVDDYILSTLSSHTDAFFGLFDSNGYPVWVKQLGGNGSVQAHIEQIDSNGSMMTVAGWFLGDVDFDPHPNNSTLLSSVPINTGDRFIAAYDINGDFLWVNLIDATSGIDWGDLQTSETGVSVLGGTASHLGSGVDFDPGPGDSGHPSGGFFAFYTADGSYLSAHTFGLPSTFTPNVSITDVQWQGASIIHCSGRFSYLFDADPSPSETILNPTTSVGAEMFFGSWSNVIFTNDFQ